MNRWFGFFLVIALGAILGLLYGWVVNPVEYVDTAPDSLRQDFRTDYVLMVAEAYRLERGQESALGLAARRLALLGDISPVEIISQAVDFGRQLGYAAADLTVMQAMGDDFQSWNPSLEAPAP